ncbi:hypothetical protein, conserved [Eimeria acervulina]|uniref:PRA1 family protein n=1 Tax=Eimeria acervulina TaxID=5801 RepID=U6GZW8_EIMAC|nr:hypothetical protein, conserved [Eimeria acervulina]CDI84034.1 hypothetical protein, conserved [Eimeria acervulina]
MVDAFGGGNASQTASAVDDFYSSDAPQQQPVFCAGGPTTGSNVSTETAVQQTDADQLSPSPQAAQTRATVCLGGSPPSPSELSGTLDSHKVPGGAKFAVSQVHGVYLALHRLVLSRCAPWPEFFASSSFQRPGTGAAAVDRLERNLRYFSTNYICICCVLSLACALLNPALLGVAGLCGALCSYASFKGEVQVSSSSRSSSSRSSSSSK